MIDYFTDPPVLPGVDYFADPPALPAPQGLQDGACADCGGPALVDAQYEGVVRCSACWTKKHNVGNFVAVPLRSAPRSYVVKPWISQSERGARRSGTAEMKRFKSSHQCRICGRWLEGEWSRADAAQRVELQRQMDAGVCDGCSPSGWPLPADEDAEVGRYRVITPARPAAPEQVPAACAKLAAELAGAGFAADDIRITYALAEDLKLARPVATVALRLRHVGYAIWRDGKPLMAQIADPMLRTCSVTEFTALALGKPYTKPAPAAPAPKGPCPRCGTVVRWTKSGTWAHTIKDQNGDKIKCLPLATGDQAMKSGIPTSHAPNGNGSPMLSTTNIAYGATSARSRQSSTGDHSVSPWL